MNGDDEGGGLSAGRSRRSTAGNRMRELLEQERERLEAKRGNEDDEMFKEEEGDVDFEARAEEVEDIIDSDFDQSSDEGEEGDDELQGEKEIEEEERMAKKLSRAKAAPIGGVRKVAAAAAAAAAAPKASRQSTSGNDSQSPAKRTSFALGSNFGEGNKPRTSTRKSTINASLSVQARMKLEEKRRQEASERAVPKRKKIRLSQADRIAEALEMEEYNRESLSKYFKLEEERRERDRRLGSKHISGPWIRFRSVAEDRNAQQRLVQEIQEAKRCADRVAAATTAKTGAITTDPVIAAREAARKEREGQNTRAPSEPVAGQQVSHGMVIDEADAAGGAIDAGGASVQHSRTTTGTDIVMTDKDDERQGDEKREAEALPELDGGETNGNDVESTADIVEETAAEEPMAVELPAEYEARTYLSLHQLPDDTPWQVSWSYILGSHVDWSHYSFVPARNRPLRPRQSVCPITGLPALYKDPRSGIAFANKDAYDAITRVMAGKYQWSGKPTSESEPSASLSAINRKYEPLEMGCWLDSIDERGACHVLDKATNKSTPVAYRVKGAVAPGDEQAIVAAAQALPAGTTRSGTRRAADGNS